MKPVEFKSRASYFFPPQTDVFIFDEEFLIGFSASGAIVT